MPENTSEIVGSRNDVLEILINYSGKAKEDTFKSIPNAQNPDINEDKTRVECQQFKYFMYLKCNALHSKIETEMQSYKEDEKVKKEEALKR